MIPLQLIANVGGREHRWTLDRSPARLGRGPANDVQIVDASVSREHAELVADGARWSVRDLGSRNGTRVHGAEAREPVVLAPGDVIEVGHVQVRVASDAPVTVLYQSGGSGSSMRKRATDVLQHAGSNVRDPARLVQILSEAGRLLVLPRPLRETCEEVLGFVERALPGSRYMLLLREGEGRELTPIAARYARGASSSQAVTLSQTIVNLVLDENTAVLTGDAMNDPRFAEAQSIVAQFIHSALAVPLFDDHKVLGLLYVDSASPSVIYGEEELELATLLGNMAAAKISNSRLLEAEQARQRLAAEAASARQLQRTLLPEAPRDVPGWSFSARLDTCFEVGGDLYDFHRLPDGTLVFLVGDVSGKGMGAALLMSSAMSSARVLYELCDGPLALVERLNAVLHRSSDSRSFLTLFVGWLDPASGRLRYVNAGHPDPHLARGDRVRSLEATGIPVAMLPSFPWTEGEVVLDPGETIAVFSDGVIEARRGDQFFELEGVANAMRELGGAADLDHVSRGLVERVDAFADGGHRDDDLTLVLVRRNAGAA